MDLSNHRVTDNVGFPPRGSHKGFFTNNEKPVATQVIPFKKNCVTNCVLPIRVRVTALLKKKWTQLNLYSS